MGYKDVLNPKLYKDISSYCSLNDIEDADIFITKLIQDKFNEIRFSTSPMGRVQMETTTTPKEEEKPKVKKKVTVSTKKVNVIKK